MCVFFYYITKHRRKGKVTNHDCVPRHGGEKLIEQISEAKFIDNPIIAINVDDGLVKIEHNDNVVLIVVASHVSRKPEEICVLDLIGSLSSLVCGWRSREMRFGIYTKQWRIF